MLHLFTFHSRLWSIIVLLLLLWHKPLKITNKKYNKIRKKNESPVSGVKSFVCGVCVG